MEVTYETTKAKLNHIFRDVFDDDDIEVFDTMTAADLEDWDSLMHITLVVTIEKEFNMQFVAAEVGRLENVGQMIDMIVKRVTQ